MTEISGTQPLSVSSEETILVNSEAKGFPTVLTSTPTVPYGFEYDLQTVEPQDTSMSITHSNPLDAVESIAGNLQLAASLEANPQVDKPQQSIDMLTRVAQSRLHRHLARAGAHNLTNAFLFAITLLGLGLLIQQPPMAWIALGYAMGHSMSFLLATLSATNHMQSSVSTTRARHTTASRGA